MLLNRFTQQSMRLLLLHKQCIRTRFQKALKFPCLQQMDNQSGTRTCASSTSRPSTSDLYNKPELYQAIFSYRNVEQEVKFLESIYRKHSQSAAEERKLKSVLDIGAPPPLHADQRVRTEQMVDEEYRCGPGEHAVGFVLAAVQLVVGLDLSSEMLRFAKSSAISRGATAQLESGALRFVQGDICEFDRSRLGAGNSFDMVTVLLGTFSHMLDNTQALKAFSCVAEMLNPGGLFILELAHPGDLFDGSLIDDEAKKEVWEVEKTTSGNRLLIEWGCEMDDFDPATQVIDRRVSITEFKGQKGEEVLQHLEERVPARQYTSQEIDLLARASGMEVVELYGDMETGVNLQHEEAYRLVAVLRKPVSASTQKGT